MNEFPEPENKLLTFDDLVDISADDGSIEVPIKGRGVVKVRPLTKRETRSIRNATYNPSNGSVDGDRAEKMMVMLGSVQPTIDEIQYEKLLDSDAAVIETILNAVMRLSGIDQDDLENALKGAVKRFPA